MSEECLSNHQIQILTQGAATSAELGPWSAHLEDCEACRCRLEAYGSATLLRSPSAERESLSTGDAAILLRIAANTHLLETTLPKTEIVIPGFRIESLQGEGGQARVYRARQVKLDNRVVALKVLGLGAWPVHKSDLARFSVEAQAYCKLDHANIVRLYDVGEYQGYPYLVLEYIEGGTLRQFLDSNRLSPKQAAELVKTLCLAVQHAHERGVIHRDLKPNNIFLTQEGVCKVGDFGLARLTESDSGVTHSSHPIGSKEYASPEQAQGKHLQVSPTSDVYSLGAILYEILAGRPPFLAHDWSDLVSQIKSADPASPRSLRRGLPRDLETICLKCLRKLPVERYPTAEALAKDLNAFLEARPLQAKPPGLVERCIKFARRNVALVSIVAALSLGLLLSTAGAILALQSRIAADNSRKVAESAEAARRSQYAQSLIDNAKYHAVRGAWDRAIRVLQEAGQLDPEWAGPAHLELAKIYTYQANRKAAQSELQIAERLLGATPGLLLAKATLSDSSNPYESLAAARQSLLPLGRLSDADTKFAQALCAGTYLEAVTLLESTLLVDPSHRPAGRMYIGLMILTGRFDKAEQQIQRMRVLLPEDDSYVLAAALREAALGRSTEALRLIDAQAASLEPGVAETYRGIVGILARLAPQGAAPLSAANEDILKSFQNLIPQYLFLASSQKKHEAGLPIPPGLYNAYASFGAMILQESPQLAIENLVGGHATMSSWAQKFVLIHEDALSLHILGQCKLLDQQFEEAQLLFEKAAQSHSLVDLRRTNTFWGLRCMVQRFAFGSLPEPNRTALAIKIRTFVEELLKYGKLNDVDYYHAGEAARLTQDWDLLQKVGDQWRSESPTSAGAHFFVSKAAYENKNYFTALDEAKKAQKAVLTEHFRANGGYFVVDAGVLEKHCSELLSPAVEKPNVPSPP